MPGIKKLVDFLGKSCTSSHVALPIQDRKVIEGDAGSIFIEGYANTKGHADRYGDIPTEYNGRGYVYDFAAYMENPVVLANHHNNISAIVGRTVEMREDARGLWVRMEIPDLENDMVQEVRRLLKADLLRTLSIGGRFYYEDPNNPAWLTYAEIYEISLVAVPADSQAIVGRVEKAQAEADTKTKQSNLHLAKQGLDTLLGKLKADEEQQKIKAALKNFGQR
jgi:HK97 family phage prohead protease